MDKHVPSGMYKHYKGNQYTVFCIVQDIYLNKYVLYRQNYGSEAFWLRPLDSFLETVIVDGENVRRFQPEGKPVPVSNKIRELINILSNNDLVINHSETKEEYCIAEIQNNATPIVYQARHLHSGGYLTEYELASRMGFRICKINNELKIIRSQRYPSNLRLKIGDNNESIILKQLNPCSIDLRIAESGFLKTRFKKLDISSIEHPANANDLWKPVKIFHNNSGDFIKLKPYQTILTHTKEKILIPSDCAGKIEVKSTYARLSLSVTMGDFCNPGYYGYFPLEITNHGRHTIILQTGETMVQLILIPLSGPIINHYAQKATYINDKGYDDGNPFTFYRERSIRLLRRQSGSEEIINMYQAIHQSIDINTVNDLNFYRSRFENNFLTYCQKKITKKKYLNNQGQPDPKKLCEGYIRKEGLQKKAWNIPFGGIISSIFIIVGTIVGSSLQYFLSLNISRLFLTIAFIIGLFVLFVSAFLYFIKPKEFCTLDKIDIDQITGNK